MLDTLSRDTTTVTTSASQPNTRAKCALTREAVDARGDGRLVGEVARHAALVGGSRSTNERRVEDEAVLGSVAARLQRSAINNNNIMNNSSPPLQLMKYFAYRKSAFSAPKICTVDAGYFAKLVKLPALEISRAPTYAHKHIVSQHLACTKYLSMKNRQNKVKCSAQN